MGGGEELERALDGVNGTGEKQKKKKKKVAKKTLRKNFAKVA